MLPGEDPTRLIDSWLVWRESGPPTMALEIASNDKKKDYVQVPAKYADLGVRELIVYDPLRGMRPRSSRLRWQVFRREEERFPRVVATDDVRIWSDELGCYLEEEGPAEDPRVRLYVGPDGARRLPTPLEWSEARLENEKRLREEEQRLREEEQRLREEAEAEVRRLRAELDRARES